MHWDGGQAGPFDQVAWEACSQGDGGLHLAVLKEIAWEIADDHRFRDYPSAMVRHDL